MYDSHAHLDLLIEKTGLNPQLRYDTNLNREELFETALWKSLEAEKFDISILDSWLENHNFVIQPTISAQNFLIAAKLFKNYSKIYLLLGSHPEIVTQDFNLEHYLGLFNILKYAIQDPDSEDHQSLFHKHFLDRLIGIGECGLDYSYTSDESLITTQHTLFRKSIELALELQLPLVIHTRDAWDDTWRILDEYPEIHGNFLIHCFTGDVIQARRTMERGGKMALGGILTFKNGQDLRDAAEYSSIESLVLETDLPFLAPVPYRGQICYPEMIQKVAETLAELKKTSVEEIWENTQKNCLNLFTKIKI